MDSLIHLNSDFPDKSVDDPHNSVDVITCMPDGFLNIGFYNFTSKKWGFHTVTLSDPYEGGKLDPFVWIYCPDKMATEAEKLIGG